VLGLAREFLKFELFLQLVCWKQGIDQQRSVSPLDDRAIG
jgi:hypothetical protein